MNFIKMTAITRQRFAQSYTLTSSAIVITDTTNQKQKLTPSQHRLQRKQWYNNQLNSTKFYTLILCISMILLAQLVPQPVECLLFRRWRHKKETERKQRMNDIMVGLTLGVLSNAIGFQQHQSSPLLNSMGGSILPGAGGGGGIGDLAGNLGANMFMKRSEDFDIEDAYETSTSASEPRRSRSLFRFFAWPKFMRRFGKNRRKDEDSDEPEDGGDKDSQAKQIERIKEVISRWDDHQSKVGTSKRPIIAVNGRGYTIDDKNQLSFLKRMAGKRR